MELKRLGDYVDIKTGKLDANASNVNGEYPFFTCSINNLWIDTYAYDCECVLIAGNGDLNVKYYIGKFNAYQRTYIVESKDNKKLYTRYLFYFMSKYVDILRSNSIGGVIKYIKLADLTEVFIPLPSLETQKRIAEVLDKAQALIDARKEQIRLMDELIQAQFIEMFGDPVINPKGWEVSKLKNHVNNIESGWSPKCLNSEAPINKWGILKLSAVTGGQYKDECNKKLPEDVSPRLGLEIKDGDLLLTRKNTPELVGDSCFVFKTRKKLMMPDIVFRIQTKKTLNRLFLWSAFNTNEMKSRIRSLASGSAKSMSNISKAKLYDLEVIVPNIDLQNDFEIRVRKIVSYKELLLKSLSELETYNKGLFKESFISDFLEVHR